MNLRNFGWLVGWLLIGLLAGCQNGEPVSVTEAATAVAQSSPVTHTPTTEASTAVPPTAVPATPEPTATPNVIATALAQDAATRAAGPTRPPTATPKPIPTLDPTVDRWWNDAVFYEVFVRSFQDSDGDGVGDINGLIERLDYLQELGVNALWLMPIMESPSYHGYDVVDYYAVDQEYGTADDFRRLMEEAHARDMRVVVDLVLNHTGLDHPWFVAANSGDPEFRDWYVWEDPAPNYLGPWGQRVWYAGEEEYYYAVFWSGMPDLNLSNPDVTAELYEITRFWLEDMGVDGFRMDAVRHFIENGAAQENTPDTHAWLQAYHDYYKNIDPDAFTVGETWTDTQNAARYAVDENDIAFDFDLAEAYVRAAGSPISGDLYRVAELADASWPTNQFGVFLTNHDQNRVMSLLRDPTKAKIAAALLMTSPGVPFLYYGEEIGMTGTKPDEDIRLPMQWSSDEPNVGFTSGTPWRAPAADYPEVSVALQDDDPDSLLNHYRALIALRLANEALREGEWTAVTPNSNRLYAFLRYTDNQVILVLFNLNPNPVQAEDYSLELAEGPLSGGVTAVSLFGPEVTTAPTINDAGGFTGYTPLLEIPGQSVTIIQLSSE
ncbi:MAG: alpha-amylase [Chloroflexi bacterium]|nr:alpha-amylase [Chloroflexota bacterium]